MLNFLTRNNIMDMAGLNEHFGSMIDKQMDIRDKLKPIERRLATLKKHIEQVDIYMKYKGKKPLTDTEQALFVAAHSYLKDEVTEAEQIRKSVYSILRQEQREQQPRRAQDMERKKDRRRDSLRLPCRRF